jgi:hypothetical protein
MNAAAMLRDCFEHQHPEAYGRPEVVPEFPRESVVNAEPMPEGVNSEGYVWPDLLVVPEGAETY